MVSYTSYLKRIYHVQDKLLAILEKASHDCQPYFRQYQERAEYNQAKVLHAFQVNQVSDFHLNGSTGYGYGDSGRDVLEDVFAAVFQTEKALVRCQIVSGTHALALALLGNLKQGDEMIIVTGRPYDTLQKVIGYHREPGSLADNGVLYHELPLLDGRMIDLPGLFRLISPRTKLLLFQRSRGYEWRQSFSISQLEQAIKKVKSQYPQIICLVDNCYGEFVETKEPPEAGADLTAGSLIKNPGGGLALTGGYLVGKKEYIDVAATRLTAPGIGSGVGASLNFNRSAFQGLFMAPLIVSEAVKGAILAAGFFSALGYNVLPGFQEERTDIIQAIEVGSRELMIKFCRGLQKACPLDSQAHPLPALLPGYENEIIMAGGTFIQGSSIELSADGPIRPPYIIYLQGGLALGHVKTGLALAAQEMLA
jgi:cystathionine beta-lyase family protein involved in aluminum resistance